MEYIVGIGAFLLIITFLLGFYELDIRGDFPVKCLIGMGVIILLTATAGIIYHYTTPKPIKKINMNIDEMKKDQKLDYLLKAAMANDTFKQEMLEADNDRIPEHILHASDHEKVVIVCTYYGWLVGRYGSTGWRNNI